MSSTAQLVLATSLLMSLVENFIGEMRLSSAYRNYARELFYLVPSGVASRL